MKHPMHIVAFVSISLAALLGCGRTDGRVKVYPVSGQVLVQGTPAEGAKVIFYPNEEHLKGPGKPIPQGVTDANGQFRLRSYAPNDGAPEGEFTVAVLWPEPSRPNVREDDEMYEPRDRLGGRYLDPKKSNLSATVKRGGGTLPPFELE